MKKIIHLLLLSHLILASCSCSVIKHNVDVNKISFPPQEKVISVLSDSVANVIFSDALVSVYMVEGKNDTVSYSPDSLVCDMVVKKKVENIDKSLVSALQFVLSDGNTYLDGDMMPSAPFMPGYVIEFSDKDNKVCHMMISISGGFCRLYWNEEMIKEFKYTQERLITYFLLLTTEDGRLKKIMEL